MYYLIQLPAQKFTQLIQWMTPLDGDYIQKNIWGRADMEFLFERVSAANK